MLSRKFCSALAAIAISAGVCFGHPAAATSDANRAPEPERVYVPLNLAILIQDNLIPQVGNEVGVTRDFIRSLPKGSRVMVGYITTGTLQVRQPFTTDLNQAASSLRIPIGSDSAAPFNPYVEVIEGLKKFDSNWKGHNAVLLISDGLDTSHGFDATTAGHTLDIDRAIDQAKKRNVAIYSFYAPSVGLTSQNLLAVSYAQSSLNRVSRETGGMAFFQGITGFVTFDPYFNRLRRTLNEQHPRRI